MQPPRGGLMDGSDSDRWLEEQLKLRKREVDATVRAADAALAATAQQTRTTKLQVLAVSAALVASVAAGFGAYQAAAAVRASEQGAQQVSADSQLSTAIAAIGGGTSAQRVGGMTLLDLNVQARISMASNALTRQEALGEYITAVDVLANYIREENPSAKGGAPGGSASSSFYPGYGYPPGGQGESFDVLYAAAQLRELLGMEQKVKALQAKPGVGVDLTGDELWGLSWSGVNFGWVAAWMPGIDLRGANLQKSDWARANLRGAFLQCADLSGTDFAGAYLAGANLSGSNVTGANFTHAHLRGAKLTGIFGNAKGLARHGLSVSAWNPSRIPCDSNPLYWDKQTSARPSPPVAAASPAVNHLAATK
jgi:Pentapeptide repeats (8 copies)